MARSMGGKVRPSTLAEWTSRSALLIAFENSPCIDLPGPSIPPAVVMHPTFNWTKLRERHKLDDRGSDSLLEAAMDRFLDRRNIERYRRLRETPNAAERLQIMRSLAEEETKFRLEFRNVDAARDVAAEQVILGRSARGIPSA